MRKMFPLSLWSLNPCCAGRCSSTTSKVAQRFTLIVSILVVLDDALVHEERQQNIKTVLVSILVVLDDALVHLETGYLQNTHLRLNPCCAGRCSSTPEPEMVLSAFKNVSQSLLCWTML